LFTSKEDFIVCDFDVRDFNRSQLITDIEILTSTVIYALLLDAVAHPRSGFGPGPPK